MDYASRLNGTRRRFITEKNNMKKTKVLIATGLKAPSMMSLAYTTKILVEGLPKNNIDVSVVSFDTVMGYPRFLRHGIYFFKLLFKSFSASVIYAQDPVSVGFPAMFVSKILHKRFILRIVGDYAWEQGVQRRGVVDILEKFSTEYDKYPLFVRVLKKIQHQVAESAEMIVVPSEYIKHIVSNWGIKKEKIITIYQPFEAKEVNKSKEDLRKELSVSGRVILSVGRLVPWKRYGVIIETMPNIFKTFPDSTLIIIGKGPDMAFLKDKTKSLKLEKHVKFLGMQTEDKINEYTKAADVFLSDSSYESFSSQLLEVFSIGTPVVLIGGSENAEIIEHEKNALVVKSHDSDEISRAVTKILSDESYSNKLIVEGKRGLDKFAAKEILLKFVSIFKK